MGKESCGVCGGQELVLLGALGSMVGQQVGCEGASSSSAEGSYVHIVAF